MKRKLLLNSIMALSVCISHAQITPPSLIPPSPNAYSLGKYGDVPVSLYTGVPNISIPVYSFSNHDVGVDISLSYHGSGIKVDEVASAVGLGWSLNAGGTITRTAKGKAEYLMPNNTLVPERSDIHPYQPFQNMTTYLHDNDFYGAVNGGRDPEPDEFFFNFAGRSGKFCFDKNGIARLEKQEPLDIKWYYDGSVDRPKFIIKDEQGVTYEFADVEFTYYENPAKPSAWFLTKITSPTGNVINLEYNTTTTTDYVRSYSEVMVVVTPSNTSISGPPINGLFFGVQQSQLRIKKIYSLDSYVEFVYNATARLDVPASASPSLKEINVYNNDSSCLKKVKLTTGYFEANNYYKFTGPNTTNYQYLNFRLKLEAVQTFDGLNNAASPPYVITYLGDNNPATDDPLTLPARLSVAQDHWGFFNKVPNPHLIPGKTDNSVLGHNEWYSDFKNGTGSQTSTTIGGGANREVNTDAIRAGMISKLKYPTGGHTEFIFEPNDFANFSGGVRIKKIIDHPAIGLPKETEYQYLQGYTGLDPKKHYFEYYKIDFTNPSQTDTYPGATFLQAFNLPTGASAVGEWIKVTTAPTAILGIGSKVGYYQVNVRQVGNGTTEYYYDDLGNYPDYIERDVFQEETVTENNLLGELYITEFISDTYSPTSPQGVYARKTSGGLQRWPYPELYKNDWKRGVLKRQKTYTESGILIRNQDFEYNRKLQGVIPGFIVKGFDIPYSGASGSYLYCRYFEPYALIQPKKTITTDFDQAGLNPVLSTAEYFYDNPNHLQVTRVETTKNNGVKETVLTTYPDDYASGTTFIDDMKASHLISYPIERVSYLEKAGIKKIKSGQITLYKTGGKGLKDDEYLLELNSPIPVSSFKLSNRSIGILPPVGSSTAFASDGAYSHRMNFINYDTKGNLTQFGLPNDVVSSVIWGYNKQYPVVKAVNAQNTEIFHSNFEEGGWEGTPEALIYQPITGYDNTRSHTGKYSGKITNTSSGEYICHSNTWLNISLTAPKKFKYSGWIYSSGPSADIFLFMRRATETDYFTHVTAISTNVTNKWVYIEGEYLVPADITKLNIRLDCNSAGTVWYDDIKIWPAESQISTYTYDPLIGMTSRTDPNNKVYYYEYDQFGRLKLERDEYGNIIKTYQYNYKD